MKQARADSLFQMGLWRGELSAQNACVQTWVRLVEPARDPSKLARIIYTMSYYALRRTLRGLRLFGLALLMTLSSAWASAAPILNQKGNPIYGELKAYESWLSKAATEAARLTADAVRADNMLSWQLPSGGFYKHPVRQYDAAWNGRAARADWTGANGAPLGTIDNDATVSELLFLANVYRRTGNTAYRDGARQAMDFLLMMQYPSGGFPQVYPARIGTTYSNYVTFNDDAMARVMALLDHAAQKKPPLDADVFSADQHAKIPPAIAKGVDFILKAQIVQDYQRAAADTQPAAGHRRHTPCPAHRPAIRLPSASASPRARAANSPPTRGCQSPDSLPPWARSAPRPRPCGRRRSGSTGCRCAPCHGRRS